MNDLEVDHRRVRKVANWIEVADRIALGLFLAAAAGGFRMAWTILAGDIKTNRES